MGSFGHDKKTFLLNGEPFTIYAGAIHYFRTVPEYWEDRLRKLKLAGFNTVETYVCWNLHEPKKGEFDFSGILDLKRFVEIARDLGLYAIVRPGPYICAEWDFGGLPAWLLADPGMRIRCCYEPYLNHVRDFYQALLQQLLLLQITNGGNIIAMQVENEYGSYGNDHKYIAWVEQLMLDCGVDVMLFTSDGGEQSMLSGGTLPHIFKTANFGSGARRNFKNLRDFQKNGPLMCCEFWDGWFDHWGEKVHHTRSAQSLAREFRALLDMDASVNFYMFHGGTNFGYMSGANYDRTYNPTVTSYDYDALLNEWGGYTEKYHTIRKILLEKQGLKEEALPPEPPLQNIGSVNLTETASLLQNLEQIGTRHESVTAESMEHFGQNYGLILYRHQVEYGNYPNASLSLDGLHDRAYVFLDGKYKGMLWRNEPGKSVSLGKVTKGSTIDVLVEGMGRVNYGSRIYDRKGVRQIRLGMQVLSHFTVYCLPLDGDLQKLVYGGKADAGQPKFLRGSFQTNSQADCFVHMDGFGKGLVWVNGFHLGRYWEVGPQMSLYLPGTVLKQKNELIVLELENGNASSLRISDKPNLGRLKKRFLFF